MFLCIEDPLQIGRGHGGEFFKREELDPARLFCDLGFAVEDFAFEEVGSFGEAVDGGVVSDEPVDFDAEAGFFENFSNDRGVGGFAGVDASSGEDPDGDVSSFDEENFASVGRKNSASDALRDGHEKEDTAILFFSHLFCGVL